MRLKRKLSYAAVTPGPIYHRLKYFRTKTRARRWCKAHGFKWFEVIRNKKPRRGWIFEKPQFVDLGECMVNTLMLEAKDLSDQFLRIRTNMIFDIIQGMASDA